MTRQAYVDRSRKLMVFWSPKCGCTTIANWWYAGPAGCTAKGKGESPTRVRRFLAQRGYEVRLKQLTRLDLSAFHKIVIARHPFNRAVSAYIDKFVGRNPNRVESYSGLKGFAADFWRDIRGIGEQEAAQAYDGLSFVEFLQAINSRVADRGNSEPALNRHWNTQVPFAFDMKAPYDAVYDIERLTQAFEEINASHGFTFIPDARRATNYDGSSDEFLGDVSSLDLAREGRRLSKENLHSADTAKLVRQAYDIDFRTFGYS